MGAVGVVRRLGQVDHWGHSASVARALNDSDSTFHRAQLTPAQTQRSQINALALHSPGESLAVCVWLPSNSMQIFCIHIHTHTHTESMRVARISSQVAGKWENLI